MRALRTLSVLLGIVLAITVLAAWLVPQFMDWNAFRSTIAAVASAGLGRPVRIDGPIRLSLLPQPVLRAGAVSIADTGDGASATAAEMRLRVGLGNLLAGQVKPRELVLQGARMHLPWPLSGPILGSGRPVTGLRAELEDATLELGHFAVTAISGELFVDPATGTLSASGMGTTAGRAWQITGRLGRPGSDGSATIEVSLDGQDRLVNTGGLLSGQIAPDGSLTGRITGRGPDLSLLLTAPAQPWQADGRLVASGGLAVADDLELEIGGAPARGAVALRFLPQLRLDAALATSRLDLDSWLPPLLHGGSMALPTGIDLSAEAAPFAGGILRSLRAGFELQADGVVVRDATATLPGDADLHVTGRLQAGRFTGAGQLDAPSLPQTLAWLRPYAPALFDALPASALHTASLSGSVIADGDSVAIGGLKGKVDTATVAGDVALHGGAHPALVANLQLAGLLLDPWLPMPPDTLSGEAAHAASLQVAALPGHLTGFNADVTIEASQPVWLGMPFDRFALGLRSRGGALDLSHAVLTGADITVGLSGSMAASGTITDGRFDVRLQHASLLGARLPLGWHTVEPLFRGPAALHVTLSGEPAALRLTTNAAMADAELQLDGVVDVPTRRWAGGVSLRHPGAPRLLETLGLPGAVSWLGDGSLSLQANVTAGADSIGLANVDVAAGALRATGDLAVSGLAGAAPKLTGSIKADTLPLPLPYAHSNDPWLLSTAGALQAAVSLRASHVLLGLSPVLENAVATVELDHGQLRLHDVTASVAGGALSGALTVTATTPPRLTLDARLAGAALAGPLLETALDVSAGRLDATLSLSASGYSPAGLLATLGGSLHATIQNGTLDGLDLAAVTAALNAAGVPAGAVLPGAGLAGEAGAPGAAPSGVRPDSAAPAPGANSNAVQAQVATALGRGATPFSQLQLAATATNGAVTVNQAAIDAPAGQLSGAGSLDLLNGQLLAALTIQPAIPGAPAIALRLSGPGATPRRTPDLATLARWLAGR